MEVIKLCAAFSFIIFSLHEVLTRDHHHHHIPSRRTPPKYREFYCRKAKVCSYEGNKVCGWDEGQPFLATFDDICTMYRANCRGVGVFFEVNMIVCDTKLSYEKEHVNETFDFIHLRPTVTEPHSTWYATKSTPKPGLIMRIQRMKLVETVTVQ